MGLVGSVSFRDTQDVPESGDGRNPERHFSRGLRVTRTLIIVRTHRADAASLAAFDLYAGLDGMDVVFCVDERAGEVDFCARPKVGFDSRTLRGLGLYAHPNCGWRCGDYFYYVIRTARPDYDFYWMVEPDVRINTNNLAAFMATFAAQKHDFLAPQFGPRNNQWGWTRTILPTGMAPHGCLYPITRLSARAIDHMFAVRRAHSADERLANADSWPNDEVFTASVLEAGGFSCADINQLRPCTSAASLNVGAVTDSAVLEANAPDEMIYHPVRAFEPWLKNAEQRVATFREQALPRTEFHRLRAEASFLNGVALACLRHPSHQASALVPLMLAQDLWQRRPWAEISPHDTVDADHEREVRCGRLLARHFGAGDKRPIATAHLVQMAGSFGPLRCASDFVCGPAVPIGRCPVETALPYTFDARDGSLILTLHIRAETVFLANDLIAEQRRSTRAIARVTKAELPYFNKKLLEASASSVAQAASAMLQQLAQKAA